MQYNTSRELMPIKEYGRNIHNMVKRLQTIQDKEKRQRNAESIIEIMAILNPQLKNLEDYRHKLWDHLFLIADYNLDVESPYPIPTKEVKQQKPEPLPYPKQKIRWNHFGKAFENLFDRALNETDAEKKQGYIQVLALFMKTAYSNWHKENVHDDMIKDELATMSRGKLIYEPGTRFTEYVETSEHITHAGMKKHHHKHYQTNGNNRNSKPNRFGNNNNNNRNNKFNRFKKK